MAELIWSERAISDIENIYDYIAHDSPMYAQLTSESIIKSVERLQSFPESGRRLPEFPQLPYREVITVQFIIMIQTVIKLKLLQSYMAAGF